MKFLKSCFHRRFVVFLSSAVFMILSCQLTQSDKEQQQSLSFNKIFDQLSQYDSVQILLKDTTGRIIDIVYRGRVDTISEIENLPAPHWDGGMVLISIVGYKAGEIEYKVDRKFDGSTDKTVDSVATILSGTSLTADSLDLHLQEGDSIHSPEVIVTPVELFDKSLTWTSSQPKIASVSNGFLKATQRGTSQLTAKLSSNPGKSITFNVTVAPNPNWPDSLSIVPDSLSLAANGASEKVSTQVWPVTASAEVIWGILDTTLARISSGAVVQGLKQGKTRLWAKSVKQPSVSDTVSITISGPMPVEQVRFEEDSIDIFIGGAAESLLVQVSPPKANTQVEFQVGNASKISLVDGKIIGLALGTTQVIVRSGENRDKSDTLKVNVFATQNVDSVQVMPDSLKLFTGGAGDTLIGKVFPTTALQDLHWRAQNPEVAKVDASGKVEAVAAGKTVIFAQSRADSSKRKSIYVIVKKDMPQVNVGRDTVISLGQTVAILPTVIQEYGQVVQFKWDLNGDGEWDGIADSIKSVSSLFNQAKEYAVRFYVKDSEGNDTTVVKNIKVVKGPAVQILSPLNNTYTKDLNISVSWSLNGKVQDSLLTQALNVGANSITRSAKDEAGNVFSAIVTVYLDTTAPGKPMVHGPAYINSLVPTWTWSGGGGGNGTYRYRLDDADMSRATEIKDTTFTSATELTEALHTLFVQERDAAGNWSAIGRWSIHLDTTASSIPNVTVSPASPTNNRQPTWSWTSGGNGGMGRFRIRLDTADMQGAVEKASGSFTKLQDLSESNHILYVQERDSAGNWSQVGSKSIVIDLTPPLAPKMDSMPPSPLNTLKPTWIWKSGGGGIGTYRCRIDNIDMANGADTISQAFFTSENLDEQAHTLYVQERDSAGNWSPISSRRLVLSLKGVVGSPGISQDLASNISLDFSKTEQPYIAYSDEANGGKITIKRFNGSSWITVGDPGFSKGKAWWIELKFNKAGIPYVAFVDDGLAGRPVVCIFDGVSWKPVGGETIYPSSVGPTSLAIDSSNNLYVAFRDGLSEGKATVLVYNGSSWSLVGDVQFSPTNISSPKIVVDGLGNPIVAFTESIDSMGIGKVSVMTWKKSGAWVYVGDRGFATSGKNNITLISNSSGELFLGFVDGKNGNRVSVMKFAGSGWTQQGNSGISWGEVQDFSIQCNRYGVPYLAFSDVGYNCRITVVTFNGTTWKNVGGLNISPENAYVLSMKINSDGVPFIGFCDGANGLRATVMKTSFEP